MLRLTDPHEHGKGHFAGPLCNAQLDQWPLAMFRLPLLRTGPPLIRIWRRCQRLSERLVHPFHGVGVLLFIPRLIFLSRLLFHVHHRIKFRT